MQRPAPPVFTQITFSFIIPKDSMLHFLTFLRENLLEKENFSNMLWSLDILGGEGRIIIDGKEVQKIGINSYCGIRNVDCELWIAE